MIAIIYIAPPSRAYVERTAEVEGEAQSVGVGPGKHVGAQRGTLRITPAAKPYDKATESGHDLPQSVDLRSEVLVRAVRDEDHSVGGVKEPRHSWEDM